MTAGRSLALIAAAAVAAAAVPAHAESRWLACKFTDQRSQVRNFQIMFDDLRNTAALWDGYALIQGENTAINFQSLRTRFPQFVVTYNRNDGALAVTLLEGSYGGGILNGECRRSPPPANAPRG